jgi:DNA polymerase-3 subunit epsilon
MAQRRASAELGESMDFVVIDFETANPDLSSICQVGVVKFVDGKVCDSWESLVNPEDYFDDMNVAVHGIEEHMVRTAPRWSAIHKGLEQWVKGAIVASHTAFDRAAFNRACDKGGISPHECHWLDTARVVRRTWPEFSQRGYGLENLARHFGIEFRHHNAKEDARAAGEIFLLAIASSGLTVDQWLVRASQPIHPENKTINLDGNSEGLLFGEKLVFTGSLAMSRKDAAAAAAYAGCEVDAGVTKHTSILVVGDQDIQKISRK